MMGLSPNDFAARLEVHYATNPSGILTGSLEKTMTANSLYLNSKSNTINPYNEPTTSLFTPTTTPVWTPPPLSTPHRPIYQHPIFSPDGSQTKCETCGKGFPTSAQAKDPSRYYRRCKQCFQDEYNKNITSVANNPPWMTNQPPKTSLKTLKVPPVSDPKSVQAVNSLLAAFEKLDDDNHWKLPGYESESSL